MCGEADRPLGKQQIVWLLIIEHEEHGLIGDLIYILFFLHVAGALKHQLEGYKELQRMWR